MEINDPPLVENEPPFMIVDLIYDKEVDTTAMTNVLLIHDGVNDFETFKTAANSDTFPIVYSNCSSKETLLQLLQTKFNSISRIAFVFHNGGIESSKIFLDDEPLFTNEDLVGGVDAFSNNMKFIIEISNSFQVLNLDFLACNTLQYDNWKTYYRLLEQHTRATIGASDDLTGNLKYGGDWILENTNEDIQNIYFTDLIENYQYTLQTVTQAGGTIYLRQLGATSVVEYSADVNAATWTTVTWPLTIVNSNTSAVLTVQLTTDITFSSSIGDINGYIIIGSDSITINGSYLGSANKLVTINGITNYPGLVQNGSSGVSARRNLTIQNIGVVPGATVPSLAPSGGWVCQAYFGFRPATSTAATYITNVLNCFSTGEIGTSSGGIFGEYTGNQLSTATTGTRTSQIYALNCYSTGKINGSFAGGIFGASAGSTSNLRAVMYAENCYSTGEISGADAGGIYGAYAGQSALGSAQIYAKNCYSTGTIVVSTSGSIFGRYSGLSASGSAKISTTNCYSIGGGSTTGIFGADKNTNLTICPAPINCRDANAYGTTWVDTDATATIATGTTNAWLDYSSLTSVSWLLKSFNTTIYSPNINTILIGSSVTSNPGLLLSNNYIIYDKSASPDTTIVQSTGVITSPIVTAPGFYTIYVLVGDTSSGVYSNYNSNTYTFTTFTVPGAPTGVSVVATGATRVNVSFTAPANNGGSAITSYIVIATYVPNGNNSTSKSGTETTITAINLFADPIFFTFAVFAINNVGTGASSEAATLPQTIAGSGGYVYLRQTPDASSPVEWSRDNSTQWTQAVWPTTILNGNKSSTVTVQLTTDVTFSSSVGDVNGYINIGSDSITIDGSYLGSANKLIIINGITSYPGFVKNSTSFTNITIQNIGVVPGITNSTLATGGGWVCHSDFGFRANTVANISNISTVRNCYSTGQIGTGGTLDTMYAGGIFGANAGYFTASSAILRAINCYSTGSMTNFAGGIFGSSAGNQASSTAQIFAENCYSTGQIGGSGAGGIFGTQAGASVTGDVRIYALNCFSVGSMGGSSSGSIFGSNSGFVGGTSKLYAQNCYSIGGVSTTGIFGAGKNTTLARCPAPINCREANAYGTTWVDTNATATIATGATNVWLDYSNLTSVPWLLKSFGGTIYNPNIKTVLVGSSVTSNPGILPSNNYIIYDKSALPDTTIDQSTGVITSPIVTAYGSYTIYVLVGDVSSGVYSNYNSNTYTFTTNTVPGAPTGVSATATGTTTATVSFTAPSSDGGTAITSYTVTATPSSGLTVTESGTGTSIPMTGLTQGTTYTFTVFATNSIGNGASSEGVVATTFTVPGAPTGVSATATGSTTATVSFTAPSSTGGTAITSYTATATPSSGLTVTESGTGTSIPMTGLTQGTTYTFTVFATNSVGNGTSSAVSNSITTLVSSITQSGGYVYLRQLGATSVVEWSPTNLDGSWGSIAWPLTIVNSNTGILLTVQLTTDITFSTSVGDVNGYIIIGSDSITINGSYLGSANKLVTINGITNYPGLVRNGFYNITTGQATGGKKNITIQNIGVVPGVLASSLSEHGGWVGQIGFGNSVTTSGSLNSITKVENCYSTGQISSYGGGILGFNAGYQIRTATTGSTISKLYAINCYSAGTIGVESGGIFGQLAGASAAFRGQVYAENCYSTGTITGAGAGGIFGPTAGLGASGTTKIYATNCYSAGTIGVDSGGIFGSEAAFSASGSALIYAQNCYTIGGGNTRGIFGFNKNTNLTICPNPINCRDALTTGTTTWVDGNATATIATGTTNVWLDYSSLTSVPWLLKSFNATIYNPNNKTVIAGVGGTSLAGLFDPSYNYILYNNPAITGITINPNTGAITCSSAVPVGNYVSEVLVGKVSNSIYSDSIYSEYNNNTYTFIVATVPGAPTGVSVNVTGSTTATVSFTAPSSDGGFPITSYTATATPSGGGTTVTVTQSGTGTSIPMTGLIEGTTYTFTVFATNAIGDGASSEGVVATITSGIVFLKKFRWQTGSNQGAFNNNT